MKKYKKSFNRSVASQWIKALAVIVPAALLVGLMTYNQTQSLQHLSINSVATNGKQNSQKIATSKSKVVTDDNQKEGVEKKHNSAKSSKQTVRRTTTAQSTTATSSQPVQSAENNSTTNQSKQDLSVDDTLKLVDDRTSVTIVNDQNELNKNVADSNAPNESAESEKTITLSPSATYDEQSTFDKATSSQSTTESSTAEVAQSTTSETNSANSVTNQGTETDQEEKNATKTFEKIQTIFAAKTPSASDVEKGDILKAVPDIYHQISLDDKKEGQIWKFNLTLSSNRLAQITVDTKNQKNGTIAEQHAAQIFKQFGQDLKPGSFDEVVDNRLLQNSEAYKSYVQQSDAQAKSGKDISFAEIIPNLAGHMDFSFEAPTNGAAIIDLPAVSIKDPKQALEELKKQQSAKDDQAKNDDTQNQLVQLKALLDAKMADATEYEKGEVFKSLPTMLQYIHEHSGEKDAGKLWNFRLPTSNKRDLFITINGKSDFQNTDFNEQHFSQILYGLGGSVKTGAFDKFVDQQILLNSKVYADYKKQAEAQQNSPLNPLLLLLGLLALPLAGLLLLAAPVLAGLAIAALVAIPLIAIPLMLVGLGLSLLSIPFFIGATILGVVGGIALATAVILGIVIPFIGIPIALGLGLLGLIVSGIGLITLLVGLAIAGISALLIIPALLVGLFFAALTVINFLIGLAIFGAVALGFFLLFVLPALLIGFITLALAIGLTLLTLIGAIIFLNPIFWMIMFGLGALLSLFFAAYSIFCFIAWAIVVPWIWAIVVGFIALLLMVGLPLLAAIVFLPTILFWPLWVTIIALAVLLGGFLLQYVVMYSALIFLLGLDVFIFVLFSALIGTGLFIIGLIIVTLLNPLAGWIAWGIMLILGFLWAPLFFINIITIALGILLTMFGAPIVAAIALFFAWLVTLFLPFLAPLLPILAGLLEPLINIIMLTLVLNVFAFLFGLGVAGVAYLVIAALAFIPMVLITIGWLIALVVFATILPLLLLTILALQIISFIAFAIAVIAEGIKLLIVLPILALLLALNPLNWILPLLALVIPLLPWLGLLISLLPIIAGGLLLAFGLFNLALAAIAFMISLISGLIGWLIALPIALITLTLSVISTLIAIGLLLTGLTALVIGAILIPILLITSAILGALALASLIGGLVLGGLALLGIAAAISNMSVKIKQVILPDWDTIINVPDKLDKALTITFHNNTNHDISLLSGAVVRKHSKYVVTDWQSVLGLDDDSTRHQILQAWIDRFDLDGDVWNLNVA